MPLLAPFSENGGKSPVSSTLIECAEEPRGLLRLLRAPIPAIRPVVGVSRSASVLSSWPITAKENDNDLLAS
jgi:hypothetical protein